MKRNLEDRSSYIQSNGFKKFSWCVGTLVSLMPKFLGGGAEPKERKGLLKPIWWSSSTPRLTSFRAEMGSLLRSGAIWLDLVLDNRGIGRHPTGNG
jgi:hypothetical protein